MAPVFFALLCFSRILCAAACCGGGGAFFGQLNEEEKRQVGVSWLSTSIIADAPVSGTAALGRLATDEEVRNRWDVSWAEMLSDRWQIGIDIPVETRQRTRSGVGQSHTGMGDIQWTLGYEILPEWSYSSWRPRGVLFARITAPTGNASWSAQQLYAVDTHGAGFWNAGMGAYFSKIRGPVDLLAWASLQKSFARTVNEPFTYRLNPGWGFSSGVGVGYSVQDFRLGVGLTYSTEQAMLREGGVSGEIPGTTTTAATLALAYLLGQRVSLSVQYTDQILLGVARNAAIGRGIGVLMRTRWERD
jgi:hypothetical protein